MNGKLRRWIVDILLILVIAAYGFIFKSVLASIESNTININENAKRIENLSLPISDIKINISQIQTDIGWIKKELNGK